MTENCLSLPLEYLAGIVEAIKTSLITSDLYEPGINTAIKNASCSNVLFDVAPPLNKKFCRKKNQDSLLEAGLRIDS
jgi:hypothetical protein